MECKVTARKSHYPKDMPFEVPEGWVWCKIEDIAESNIGLTYNPEDVCSDGVPVLRSNNIKNRRICTDGLIRVRAHILPKQFIKKGDLLICARNGSRNLVGKCALIEQDEEPMSFGAFMAVCRSTVNRWIFLILNSSYFNQYLDNSNSTAINQVTQSMLLSFDIPLPPKNEQARIYSMVERLFSCVDELEKQEQGVLAAIDDSRKRILELAIHGRLVPQDPTEEPASVLLRRINPTFTPAHNLHYEGELPKGWVLCHLDDVCGILDSQRKPINAEERSIRKASGGAKYPYYGATGQVDTIDDYLFEGNYILLGEDGAPFLEPHSPKAYPVSGKIWVNNHAHILSPKCNLEYLLYYLNSIDYRPYVTGTTRLKLTQEAMKRITIFLPPATEQMRIVSQIDAVFRVLNEIIDSINAS